MKHIDSRILWLQDLVAGGGVRLKKILRTQNLSDMLASGKSCGRVFWWKHGYRDLELCGVSSARVIGILLFFLQHA